MLVIPMCENGSMTVMADAEGEHHGNMSMSMAFFPPNFFFPSATSVSFPILFPALVIACLVQMKGMECGVLMICHCLFFLFLFLSFL